MRTFALIAVLPASLVLALSSEPLVPQSVLDLRPIAARLGLNALQIRDFAISRGTLYFLAADRYGGVASQVIVTDETGALRRAVPLPSGFEYVALAAGADGTIWVSRSGGRQGEVISFGPQGAVLPPLPAEGAVHMMESESAGGPSWISSKGFRFPGLAKQSPLPISQATLMTRSGADVVLADRSGTVAFIDTQSGAATVHSVQSGEVEALRRKNLAAGASLIHSLAGDNRGRVFALLGPVSVTDGATVVRIDKGGHVQDVFVCRPSAATDVRLNPSRLRFDDGWLLLATMDGGVFRYRL